MAAATTTAITVIMMVDYIVTMVAIMPQIMVIVMDRVTIIMLYAMATATVATLLVIAICHITIITKITTGHKAIMITQAAITTCPQHICHLPLSIKIPMVIKCPLK